MTSFEHVPVERVRSFWNRRPCNVRHSPQPVGTREYFDEVEARKYFVEPHIPAFAEFPRWKGKRVLEIGCGIGTDTMNFARAGAHVTAVDLSDVSLDLARRRADVFGLTDRIEFIRANAEKLDEAVPPQSFDLVYSFGVIHHTPHPGRVLDHARSFLAPDGELKVMVYNRNSWKVVAMAARSPHRVRTLDRLIAEYSEAQTGSPVTYAYTRATFRKLLEEHGFMARDLFVEHIFSWRVSDYVDYRYVKAFPFSLLPPPVFRKAERTLGWHLCATATRKDAR